MRFIVIGLQLRSAICRRVSLSQGFQQFSYQLDTLAIRLDFCNDTLKTCKNVLQGGGFAAPLLTQRPA